jgi:hypothetical protein
MLFIFGYTIYSYFTTPFKDVRYLFPIMLSLGYFTYIGLTSLLLNHKLKKSSSRAIINFKKLYWLLIIILIISSIFVFYTNYYSEHNLKKRYESAIDFIKNSELQDCVMYSDNWIYFNYVDENILLLPVELYFEDLSIYDHKILFLYYNQYNINYQQILQKRFPVIYKNEYFLVLGDKINCKKKEDYSSLFYELFKGGVIINQNKTIYTEPCNILFNNYKFINQTCDYFNYNVFSLKNDNNIFLNSFK